MTDQTLPAVLPAFDPVPRAKHRSNGWTAQVQRDFIEALAETGSVKAACRRVGRADHGAYMLRRHPEAAAFRAAWDAALDIGMRRIEDVAMDRALNGVEVPVYSYGKLVGTRTVYNDRLLMFMLRNRAPDRFTGGKPKALSATDAAELKRLKAQWREEWEREAAIRAAAEYDETGAATVEYLAELHRRWFTTLGPQARAAYAAFREAETADRMARHSGPWDEADHALAQEDYARWFTPDKRAKVWQIIDMVFGD
ncbi:hypothetical protein [Alteraurantiacibacter buctensis]|uniref:Uncharacterized protein n=1 Tax=Alteraurantiacibacter buctensis TaxID=1503981 RepID=A0A844YX66_9SPHN|nr:hypothetical protein [Alteraurantiacibacter buctensis]MXO71560.1 hypothetical protein [Alteraurantiacibacter buctensis]